MKKVNEEVELKIIDNYNKGLSCNTIGRDLGMSGTTVFNVLKKHNIKLRTKGGINNLPIDDIKNMYENNLNTLEQIAKKYNVTIETIRLSLMKEDVSIRKSREYNNINLRHDYFEIVDTEYKAYFLGFLITDGNISHIDLKNKKPTKRVRLSLNSRDRYILEEFKKDIKSGSSIYDDNRGCSTIEIHSKKMSEDLEQFGVICNKTWSTFLPTINKDLMPHLIRGIIDGDGWITNHLKSNGKKGYGIGLCGNKDLVLMVKDFLKSELNVYDVKPTIRGNLYSILWGSKKDILSICNYIYQNSNVYLHRKYKVYQEIKNQ